MSEIPDLKQGVLDLLEWAQTRADPQAAPPWMANMDEADRAMVTEAVHDLFRPAEGYGHGDPGE